MPYVSKDQTMEFPAPPQPKRSMAGRIINRLRALFSA